MYGCGKSAMVFVAMSQEQAVSRLSKVGKDEKNTPNNQSKSELGQVRKTQFDLAVSNARGTSWRSLKRYYTTTGR